jgi:hypothetical protein
MAEYERVETEYACRYCGHRAEADVVAGLGPHGRSNAAWALGLAACPACGRRDRKLLAIEAIVPALGGLLVGGVAFVALWVIGILGVPHPSTPVAIAMPVAAALIGIAACAVQAQRLLRKALADAAIHVLRIGDPIVDRDGAPYRVAAQRPRDRLSAPVLGARSTEGAYMVVFIGAAVLASLDWSASLSASSVAVAVAIGIVGGCIRGADARTRLASCASLALASTGILYAVRHYLGGRSMIVNYELLLPIGLGGAPGLVLDQLLHRRLR